MIRIDFSFLFLLRLKFFLNGSYLLLYLLDRRKIHLYLLDLNIIVCCSAHRSGYSLKCRLYLRLVQKKSSIMILARYHSSAMDIELYCESGFRGIYGDIHNFHHGK